MPDTDAIDIEKMGNPTLFRERRKLLEHEQAGRMDDDSMRRLDDLNEEFLRRAAAAWSRAGA